MNIIKDLVSNNSAVFPTLNLKSIEWDSLSTEIEIFSCGFALLDVKMQG